MAKRNPRQEPANVTQVTEEERLAIDNLAYEVPDRMSDREAAANIAIRCPACGVRGELLEQRGPRYAVGCRSHGRYTRWYDRNVDVLNAPVFHREQLKREEAEIARAAREGRVSVGQDRQGVQDEGPGRETGASDQGGAEPQEA